MILSKDDPSNWISPKSFYKKSLCIVESFQSVKCLSRCLRQTQQRFKAELQSRIEAVGTHNLHFRDYKSHICGG